MPKQIKEIQWQRASKETWEELNPVLNQGEPGYEKPITGVHGGRWKLGDGVTAWNDLDYRDELGGGGGEQSTYSFQQSTPAAQWNLNHPAGLRRYPIILLDDDPERPVYTDVDHVSDTLTILTFPSPVSGWAYL